MRKFRLMLELNITIHELIEMIKLKGEVVELNDSILGLPNDKYLERALLFYDNTFWVIYAIYDNYEQRCYYEDMDDFVHENRARTFYNELTNLQYDYEQ